MVSEDGFCKPCRGLMCMQIYAHQLCTQYQKPVRIGLLIMWRSHCTYNIFPPWIDLPQHHSPNKDTGQPYVGPGSLLIELSDQHLNYYCF